MSEYPLVMIEWVDSAGPEGWKSLQDFEAEVIVIRSVGWLVVETEELVTIAPHYGAETEATLEQIRGAMTIPKAAIVASGKPKEQRLVQRPFKRREWNLGPDRSET